MIDAYRCGQMVIDGASYQRDLVVLPTRVIPDWWREEGHLLQPHDLTAVLGELPPTVVIGTGMLGMMRIAPRTLDLLADRGVTALVERTGNAWKRFNDHLARGDMVAGIFHLTC